MKYLVLFLALAGCSGPSKPRHFICITAMGVAQFGTEEPNVKIKGSLIEIEQDSRFLYVDKATCVEVRDK